MASTSMPTPPSVQYVPSYSSAYSNPIIFTQAPYVAPHFSASSPMPGWTVGHPSPMFYTSGPSTFPMMSTSTTMYKPFMYQTPMESPLVIPSVHETQHSYAHSSFVTQTPPESLLYQGESSSQPHIPGFKDARWQLRIQGLQLIEGEEEEQPIPQPRPEAEPRRNPT
ncbi:hypothetical protein Gotri_017164, partial [Gossypium trilobum]|nr:hypothetical protein [Gossypium trilobum]